MYIPKGEIGIKIYWEYRHGAKNSIFTSGTNVDEEVQNTINYIRERLYMDSFRIVGVEQAKEKGWEPIEFTPIRCRGR